MRSPRTLAPARDVNIVGMEWHIPAAGTTIPIVLDGSGAGDAPLVVLGHGAGGHRADRNMLATSSALTARGLRIVRFDFPYRVSGRKLPDTMPVLQASFEAVVRHVRDTLAPRRLVIGGRSMGGRVASMLAAAGQSCDGVLLLAYPLHPAGHPEKLRDKHLAAIAAPVLCFNGTRDALCQRDLMEQVTSRLGANWRMHWIEGADHAFHVTRTSGRGDVEVLAEIAAAARKWLDDVVSAGSAERAPPRREGAD